MTTDRILDELRYALAEGEAVPAPAADVPWLSALSWPWCVPNAPVTHSAV